MSVDIIIVTAVLAAVIFFLITEWMALEVLALLVLGTLALTGVVSPIEALSGFSNPAVVTIWAVFILSGGLTRTGIANIIGRRLMLFAAYREEVLVAIIMLVAGVLSAFMNNTAVAALMLPVVMDIARKSKKSPSSLLMPLAYGSLLGGLTTMIGTPPNIIATEALRENGLTPFSVFDFTPIGLVVMVTGIAFVSFVAIRMIPNRIGASHDSSYSRGFQSQYDLDNHLFSATVPSSSPLVGMSLSQARFGSIFRLNVISILRQSVILPAPSKYEVIQPNDQLIINGRSKGTDEANYWGQVELDSDQPPLEFFLSSETQIAELQLSQLSEYAERQLSALDFRQNYGLNVLAIKRDDSILIENLNHTKIKCEDFILVQGLSENLLEIRFDSNFIKPELNNPLELLNKYKLADRIHILKVPEGSGLIDVSLEESRLGASADLQILCIRRKDGRSLIPTAGDRFEVDDQLIVTGTDSMVSIFLTRDLSELFLKNETAAPTRSMIEDNQVGLMEVMLAPNSRLNGQSLGQLKFRERYELSAISIWRKGMDQIFDLGDVMLEFGDVILLHGKWEKLTMLGQDPELLILTDVPQEAPREEKAKLAVGIMVAALFPVMMGWVPIYIAVIVGAALMIMTKCLTMEEAYRYIEWKAVFLIAGMLPLGMALDQSGAASLVAEGAVSLLGPLGPHAVLFGILSITFLATSIIPTAALVVLMVPITLNTSASMGISPHALMMGVALAASSSFTSPISHPANILVMGPGGYKFVDYMKVGIPLTLVILFVLMIFIPIFWPLTV